MNWPRYVNPAGTPDAGELAPAVIAAAIFLRFGSPSWRPTPEGPILENRNGGAAVADRSWRPRPLSPNRPSPIT